MPEALAADSLPAADPERNSVLGMSGPIPRTLEVHMYCSDVGDPRDPHAPWIVRQMVPGQGRKLQRWAA